MIDNCFDLRSRSSPVVTHSVILPLRTHELPSNIFRFSVIGFHQCLTLLNFRFSVIGFHQNI